MISSLHSRINCWNCGNSNNRNPVGVRVITQNGVLVTITRHELFVIYIDTHVSRQLKQFTDTMTPEPDTESVWTNQSTGFVASDQSQAAKLIPTQNDTDLHQSNHPYFFLSDSSDLNNHLKLETGFSLLNLSKWWILDNQGMWLDQF